MADSKFMLSKLIDDYIAWHVAYAHVQKFGGAWDDQPPASFDLWRQSFLQSEHGGEQPALERVTSLHEQLHKLVKLTAMRKAPHLEGEIEDAERVAEKYLQMMQELRRFERAMAAADSALDPLTGLRTRLTLQKDIDREISRAARSRRPFYIAIADIDHFKKINDTHGHDNGDIVLATAADLISRNLRSHDDAYRLGGEEFLICLKETDVAGCAVVLERLRKTLEQTPITLGDGVTELKLTASFGVAACAEKTSYDLLMRRADQALYKAKQSGRNRIAVADPVVIAPASAADSAAAT